MYYWGHSYLPILYMVSLLNILLNVVLSCVAVISFALFWFDQRARMSAISRQLASLEQQRGLLAAADVSHKQQLASLVQQTGLLAAADGMALTFGICS